MKSILLGITVSLIPFSNIQAQDDKNGDFYIEKPSKFIIGSHLHFYSGYEILEKSDAHTTLMFPVGFDVRYFRKKVIYDLNVSYTFIDMEDGFTSYFMSSASMGYWNDYGIISFSLISMIPIFHYDYLLGVDVTFENTVLPISFAVFKNAQMNRTFVFFSIKKSLFTLKTIR